MTHRQRSRPCIKNYLLKFYELLHRICIDDVKKLTFHFLLRFEGKFVIGVIEERTVDGSEFSCTLDTLEGEDSCKHVDDGVEIVGTGLDHTPTVLLTKLLVKLFSQGLQILYSLLFVALVEEFRELAIVLVKTDNGLVDEHQLRVALRKLVFQAGEF